MDWNDQLTRTALRAISNALAPARAARLPCRSAVVPSGHMAAAGAGRSAAVTAAALEDTWSGMPASGVVIIPVAQDRACAAGLEPRNVPAPHRGHGLFDAAGDVVRTGPTLTNTNDPRAIRGA